MMPGFDDASGSPSPRATFDSPTIAGEWDSNQLARPVVLRYAILEPTSRHQSSSAGLSEKLTFAVSE